MRVQTSLALLLLCSLLLALTGCTKPNQATAPATQVPTAQIISKPEPAAIVLSPTPTPDMTATAQALQPTATSTPLAATPTPVVRQGPGGLPYPLQLAQLNFGVVGHLYYTDRYTALATAQEAGFEWFRQQIHWRDIEDRSGQFFWGDLDNIVAAADARGVLLLISVVRSPSWHTANGSDGMPQDPASLARFVGALAARYQGRVHAIEIWNEQNLAYENGGRVALEDAGHYVELLAAAYNSIKAVDPRIIVVAGAPSSTAMNNPDIAIPDQDYLRAMYSYKDGMIRDYFDVQAIHPGGSANPPDTLWPDNPSPADGWTDDPTFYFRHVENSRRLMEEAGLGDHQVWITEFGWATQNNSPGFEFGNQISFETQRDYIVGAMQRTSEQYPWISNLFLWNLNFSVLQRENGLDPLHEQGSFSIVNGDWSRRPAFYGIQEFIARTRLAQGN
jgi:hypothetical protein